MKTRLDTQQLGAEGCAAVSKVALVAPTLKVQHCELVQVDDVWHVLLLHLLRQAVADFQD
jgi:hypothetical protein